MLMQRRKTGDDDGEAKDEKQKTGINLYHIPCNDCGEKSHSEDNNECSAQRKLKKYAEEFRKMNPENIRTRPLIEENKNHW